jgi:hypothetical protein
VNPWHVVPGLRALGSLVHTLAVGEINEIAVFTHAFQLAGTVWPVWCRSSWEVASAWFSGSAWSPQRRD